MVAMSHWLLSGMEFYPNEIQRSRVVEKPDSRCIRCHKLTFWESIYGPLVCLECHPPAYDELVKQIVILEA